MILILLQAETLDILTVDYQGYVNGFEIKQISFDLLILRFGI